MQNKPNNEPRTNERTNEPRHRLQLHWSTGSCSAGKQQQWGPPLLLSQYRGGANNATNTSRQHNCTTARPPYARPQTRRGTQISPPNKHTGTGVPSFLPSNLHQLTWCCCSFGLAHHPSGSTAPQRAWVAEGKKERSHAAHTTQPQRPTKRRRQEQENEKKKTHTHTHALGTHTTMV